MVTSRSELDPMKDLMRAPWIKGNYAVLAETLGAHEAAAFVSRLDIARGERVLDVACGTGAASLPLARRGALVTGLDMTPHLLNQARASAESEGLSISFDEGFAEELPYPAASFDMVVSMFGAMFSPFPEQVVSEVARVLRPGGVFAMANWTRAGFSGRISGNSAKYLSPQPGVISPMRWGDENDVVERLRNVFAPIDMSVIAFNWQLEMSAPEAAAFFAENAGPVQALLYRLNELQRFTFLHELEKFWVSENIAPERTRTIVRNEYLQVLATRH